MHSASVCSEEPGWWLDCSDSYGNTEGEDIQSIPGRAGCQVWSSLYCGTSQVHLSTSSLAMQTRLRAEQSSGFLLSRLLVKKRLAPFVSFVEMAKGQGKGRIKGSSLTARVETSASVWHWNELWCCLKDWAIGHDSM